MIGRRVGSVAEVTDAGDYCGPVTGYTGTDEREACFFLLPIARDADAPPGARSILHVAFPPHVYRECADGSLEIRESIGVLDCRPDSQFIWHGYLDEGHVWREV